MGAAFQQLPKGRFARLDLAEMAELLEQFIEKWIDSPNPIDLIQNRTIHSQCSPYTASALRRMLK